MTFLEYVVRRLLGEPASYAGGSPLWECPDCGRVKLHCRPPSDHYKERVACWVCDLHEDAVGIWKQLHPDQYYRHAVDALDAWQVEWEQAEQAARRTAPPAEGRASAIPPGGVASGGAAYRDDPRAVAAAWADLTEVERAILIGAHAVMRGIRSKVVSLDALARYCQDHEDTMRRMEAEHREQCTDPDCDAPVCRSTFGHVIRDPWYVVLRQPWHVDSEVVSGGQEVSHFGRAT
jgi:hypothetical protein